MSEVLHTFPEIQWIREKLLTGNPHRKTYKVKMQMTYHIMLKTNKNQESNCLT